ncbi:phycocyanobilin:ferredoxin oxidoreductase [Prochlorococcus marinus]|uniref:Phycocyanobilin:ferredoxin oxidoreductase n=1 Tax=Prochlorococcus marinus XMU1408 TaxID=2213228 RepID=A0A318RGE5_PROMR|nr:phycocyanobilin:ferredoxin oxidoreductase [Prochlorococcus marinus]MBW3041748.1 phycocyanobilin:ferredoxin oxidoreductase [Prochlorococcus marinus str. XMU1408]PYE02893.1 phycocyanobilin:ferredoxin oxidoreductase [Prochlorococcus marinus XMU1408]
MKSIFSAQSKFHPILLDAIELIKSRINSLPDVESLDFDPKLCEIYGKLDNEDLFIVNEFFQAKGFRKIHLEVAQLGKSLQILHCVFFPNPCFELPIFGVDLVISSNKISAAIVDLSPVGEQMDHLLITQMESLEVPKFKEPRILPDWGYIFSPYVCFIRPVDLCEQKSFLKLIDEYLLVLQVLLISVKIDEYNSLDTINRFKYQKLYCSNQKRNDKTRSILTRFFGSSWADEYINKILFEC